MYTCTFFGHRDAPQEIKGMIEKILTDLIVNNEVDKFYVGNNGNFDKMVLNILKDLKIKFKNIRYNVVLAYIPIKEKAVEESIIPYGIEDVPKRFAILHRNKWMVNKSDYVVTYISRSFGGAAKFADYARKKEKHIINIYNIP